MRVLVIVCVPVHAPVPGASVPGVSVPGLALVLQPGHGLEHVLEPVHFVGVSVHEPA